MEANKCICMTVSFFGHLWLLCYVVVYSKGASLLFIATDLQPLSCELWMSYQAGSKKWQINRKPDCPTRHLLPFTCIFSKPLACGMIVPYSMISYLGLLGNQTAIKWRTYMSNPQATIFLLDENMFWHSFKPTKNTQIFTRMIHYNLNKYGSSSMYIQYPIEMLVLLSVSSDPSALAFVWLVIHKLLFCSMMLHHGWKTSICWCISRSEMEACAILILALEDVVLLNISTWHQFCTCQDVMVLDYCPSRLLMLQLGINFVHQYINTSIHQSINTEIV